MKIDSIQAGNIYNAYSDKSQPGKNVAAEGESIPGGDRLEISGRASDVTEASELAKQALPASESRAAKLADIKSRIEAGTYSVPSKDVAQGILKGIFMDKKA